MTWRLAAKTLVFFAAFAIILGLTGPSLGRVSLYNGVFPGRPRLPFGEHPERAYNLSVTDLDAMFASHEIAAGPKPADEYRVVLIGDSATWGFLLKPEETLSAQLTSLGLMRGGKKVRVYNLGYPDFSLTKDFLIATRALRYQPDLLVWLTTPRSMPNADQMHAIVSGNRADCEQAFLAAQPLTVSLPPDASDEMCGAPVTRDALTALAAQRRAAADLIRFQLYGVLWAATGIDQDYPEHYDAVQHDLERAEDFRGLAKPLAAEALALDRFGMLKRLAGNVPVLVVNEPMYISDGANSDVRYNFFYPRWAYDQYRALMPAAMEATGARYVDLWNIVPPSEFTNSAVHMTPAGTKLLAARLTGELLR